VEEKNKMQKSEFCLFCWCIKREIILLQLFAQDQKITYVAAHTNGTVMSSARNYKDESRRVAITKKK
jgi:enhancing lycopene biosynthesis protein 2